MQYRFPDGCWWGSASSASQAEGASRRGGKSPNIFDYWYVIAPGRCHDGIGPAETSTFYDHYAEDIALRKMLSHNSFRTSIVGSRWVPEGDGEVNQLLRLDLATPSRAIKKSGYWFANTTRHNGFNQGDSDV